MRRNSGVIAAALVLAMLAVLVLPVFAMYPGYHDLKGDFLTVDLSTHSFRLSYSGGICEGVGAVIVKGVLAIGGKCQMLTTGGATNGASGLLVSFLSGGGNAVKGPIILVLTTVSKPPTKPMMFVLMPTIVTTPP